MPLVSPLTVKVSPSPGNEPAVILTTADVEYGIVGIGETG